MRQLTACLLLLTMPIFSQVKGEPETYPNSENIQYGYPQLEYFNRWGNSYTQIYSYKNKHDSLKTEYYKSVYSLKNNKIRVKTTSSKHSLPTVYKYRIVEGEIESCNRLGVIRKNRGYTDVRISKTFHVENDSVYCYSSVTFKKKDTLFSESSRKTYDKAKQLIKQEHAFSYALTDPEWKNAEKTRHGISRVTYLHTSDNEIKMTHEFISPNRYERQNYTLILAHDVNGYLIEQKQFNEENKLFLIEKFGYENGLCISYEITVKGGMAEKSTAMRTSE